MLLTLNDLSVCLVSKTTNLWHSVSGSETSWLRYISSVTLRVIIFFFKTQFNTGGTPKVREDYKYNNK